jgi:hypothetical protein
LSNLFTKLQSVRKVHDDELKPGGGRRCTKALDIKLKVKDILKDNDDLLLCASDRDTDLTALDTPKGLKMIDPKEFSQYLGPNKVVLPAKKSTDASVNNISAKKEHNITVKKKEPYKHISSKVNAKTPIRNRPEARPESVIRSKHSSTKPVGRIMTTDYSYRGENTHVNEVTRNDFITIEHNNSIAGDNEDNKTHLDDYETIFQELKDIFGDQFENFDETSMD